MPTSIRTVIPLVELRGTFLVENYQRGYRWTKEEVTNLLVDFTSFAQQDGLTNKAVYFLQPIVVSRLESSKEYPRWELIDGQQRLTTIYLMDAVLRNLLQTRSDLSFDIEYQARPDSADFLKKLADNPGVAELPEADANMDFYHMFQACRTIHMYFSQKDNQQRGLIRRLYPIFTGNIHILWYDTTDENDRPVERFSRLNMGRIPLTGAELSRALLLNSANHNLSDELVFAVNSRDELAKCYNQQLAQQIVTRRQVVLGSRWDDIERELHDPDFWAFLGGKVSDTRATRIGFLLDLYANKPASETKEYFAFDALSRLLDPASTNDTEQAEQEGWDAQKLWDDITRSYQMLRFWYEDHDYYHWIGYLSDQSGREGIRILLQHAKEMRKSDFKDFVFTQIRQTLSKEEVLPTLKDLEYGKDGALISKLLFLFNVEYARKNGQFAGCRQAGRFPFGEHREHSWSLEHIHAQNGERLQKYEDWRAWVRDHKKVLEEIHGESLPKVKEGKLTLEEFARQKEKLVDECVKSLNLSKKDASVDKFEELSDKVWKFMQDLWNTNEDELDSLFNLALLDIRQNIVLSNSIFAAKCHLVREMRKKGEYVPIATEALFMRRFSTEDLHLPYWSEEDRKGYEDALLDILSTFEWKTNDDGGKNA